MNIDVNLKISTSQKEVKKERERGLINTVIIKRYFMCVEMFVLYKWF